MTEQNITIPATQDMQAHTLTLLKAVLILEKKIEAMNESLAFIANQIHHDHASASIAAPKKQHARQQVVDYIDSLENFDARVFIGGYETRHKLLTYALGKVTNADAQSIALEFGVYKGESLSHISRRFAGKVYGFDSFEGLPESELIWRKGQFKNPNGLAYEVGANTELVKGWFKDTLEPFVQSHDLSRIRFIHMDCDIYSSAKEIFDLIGPHIPPETVIVFDEYWNYPGWKEGEFKAFHEFLALSGRRYTYLGYMDSGTQLAIILH